MPRRQKDLVVEDHGSEDDYEESDHSLEDSISEAANATSQPPQETATTAEDVDPALAAVTKNAEEEDSETFHPTSSDEGGGEEEASAESDNKDEDYSEEPDEEEADDDDDDESFADDSDDDLYNTKKKRKRAPTRKKAPPKKKAPAKKTPAKKPAKKSSPKAKAPPARGRSKRGQLEELSSSSEDDDEVEEETSEEEPMENPKRGAAGRGNRKNLRQTRTARVSYKDVGSSGEDSSHGDGDEDSEVSESKPTKKPASRGSKGRPSRARAAKTTKKMANDDSDEDDDGDGEAPDSRPTRQSANTRGPTGRPSRASAAKATAKMAQLRYKEEQASDVEEEEEEEEKPKPRARKKRKVNSDEEDFKADEDAADDDDEVEDDAKSSGEESFLQGVHSVPSDTQVGNADSSDLGEDEVSEDEDEKDKKKAKKPASTNGVNSKDVASDDDDDDDGAEIEPTPTKARLSQEERTKPNNRRKRPKTPHCPSETDAITTDPLPPIHVCYFSPDGTSRQCFSLETLHKIAKMSSHPQYRTNLSGEQQQTFLQPPHFRSAMSDELLDQIASRFGRQALDLDGEFYKRKNKAAMATTPGGQVDSDNDAEEGCNYEVNFTAVHTNQNLFMHSWKDYQIRNMGSQDLYPCPLCYAVAHHRLANPSAGDEEPITLPDEFKFDPMTVLGSVDNENFEIAAGFCFTKISTVKEHIRKEHKCKTARLDNALFFRYKLRAPDGLLQRFLAKNRTYGRNPKQGDMRRYWYEGNSESYIYLLYQIELLRSKEAENGDNPGSDSDTEIGREHKSYYKSFQEQAKELWEQISGPHLSNNQDMGDFLDDGEVEEGDDVETGGFNHGNLDREREREEADAEKQEDEELARYYTQKAAEHHSDDENQSVDEDDYEPAEASESEEDEWVEGLRNKKRRGSLEKASKAKGRSGRRLSSQKKKSIYAESSSDEDYGSKQPASSSKRAIESDSD